MTHLCQTEERLASLGDPRNRLAAVAFSNMIEAARANLARFDDYAAWSRTDGPYWTSPIDIYDAGDLPTRFVPEGI